MITLHDPKLETRRQRLEILKLNAAQMPTEDLRRLLCIMRRTLVLNRVWPGLGGRYLSLELARARA